MLKLTLFIFQLNLFWPLKWFRICAYIGASVSTLFYTASTIMLLAYTTPTRHQTWLQLFLSLKQTKAPRISLPVGSVGLAVDLYLLILPLFAVRQRHMQTNQKLRLGFIFSLGLM